MEDEDIIKDQVLEELANEMSCLANVLKDECNKAQNGGLLGSKDVCLVLEFLLKEYRDEG